MSLFAQLTSYQNFEYLELVQSTIATATGTKQLGIQHAYSCPEAPLSDVKHRRFAVEQ